MSTELVGLMACSTTTVEREPGTGEAFTLVGLDAVQLYKAIQGKGPDRTSVLPGSIDVQRASSIHEASKQNNKRFGLGQRVWDAGNVLLNAAVPSAPGSRRLVHYVCQTA